MRIVSNMAAQQAQSRIAVTNARMFSTLEKLSSAKRINRAGDDVAGASIYNKIEAQLRGLEMASKNAADGVNMIKTAEGTLGSAQSILQRMRELAVQSASGTNAPDRQALQAEYRHLIGELDDVATTASFNQRKLLLGALSGGSAEITPEDIVLQTGVNQADETVVSIDSMISGALGIGGTDVLTRQSASGALDRLDVALNTVSTQRTRLGAAQTRLDHKGQQLDIAAENSLATQSRIGGADMAKEMIAQMQARLLSQANMSILAQANSAPGNVLKLLS